MIHLLPIVLSAFATTFPHPMPVVCSMPPDQSDVAGAVLTDQYINVRRVVCVEANKLARTKRVTPVAAWSVTIIAHEQEHFRHPWGSEPLTQCRALNDVSAIVWALMPRRTVAQRAFAARAALNAQRLARANVRESGYPTSRRC